MTSTHDPSIKKEPSKGQELKFLEIHGDRRSESAEVPSKEPSLKPELSATSFKFEVPRPASQEPDQAQVHSRLTERPSLETIQNATVEPQPATAAPAGTTALEPQPVDVLTRIVNWLADSLKKLERLLLGAKRAAQAPPSMLVKRKKRHKTETGEEIEVDIDAPDFAFQQPLQTPQSEDTGQPPAEGEELSQKASPVSRNETGPSRESGTKPSNKQRPDKQD